MTIKLSKPITVGDKQIDEITLDTDRITGNAIINAERETMPMRGGIPVVTVRADQLILAALAATATGLDLATIGRLPGNVFVTLTEAVQLFLSAPE